MAIKAEEDSSKSSVSFTKKAAIATALLFFVFTVAHAQSVEDLQIKIQALLKQVNQLQEQLAAVRSEDLVGVENPQTEYTPEFVEFQVFGGDLWYGLKGSDGVARLQRFLIGRGFLASGLDTGNYFSRTKDAVVQYQRTRGIATTGYFGPLTRAQVNSELNREQADLEKDEDAPRDTPKINDSPQEAQQPEVLSKYGTFKVYRKPNYDIDRIEKLIQELINAERSERGLVTLAWNDEAAIVARLHSKEQALDNALITDSSKPCSYPYIRHEGFVQGFSVGDRLRGAGIRYHIAGENIAAYAISENFVYRYSTSGGSIHCPPVPAYSRGGSSETQSDAQKRAQEDVNNLIQIMLEIPRVEWVNKEWLEVEEIAQLMVEGWMNSEGHRNNMLDNRFREGGVGVAEVNDYFIATHVLLKKF